MIVITEQGYDLRTFDGPIERDESPYREKNNIYVAQIELYKFLGTDQIIHCSQDWCWLSPLVEGKKKYIH